MSLAREIGLTKAICSTKEEWRDNVLAMIVGRILCQGSKLSLVNQYMDTALWELAGHDRHVRPDVEKHCYKPMDELLERKRRIERKLAKKHLKDGCVILYDITNTWFEGEYENSGIVVRGRGKDGKVGYKQVALGLLTAKDGCPVGVEIFKGNISDQKTVLAQVKKLTKKYGIRQAVFTGDRGMLTAKRIDEISETDFKIITAMTHPDRSLQKVEQAFKNMKTVMLELIPIYHKNDERIEAHIFIVMLAYYLQWHAMERLKPLFEADGKGKDKCWTFETIVGRLKSIRKVDNLISGVVVKTNVSTPDKGI